MYVKDLTVTALSRLITNNRLYEAWDLFFL